MDAAHTGSILVVDDEVGALDGVRLTLRAAGFTDVRVCGDSREVLPLLRARPVDVLLLDLIMPHLRGDVLLEQALQAFPHLAIVVMTAEYDVRVAVRCMKLGAADYLTKPVAAGLLVATVEKVLEASALRQEAAALRRNYFTQELKNPSAFASIITAEPGMLRIFTYLEAASKGFQPVLISGETGTGKELMARALHESSGRGGPFVAVNVAGLDDEMFSDTLFGHVAGAFTGAAGTRKGMIEAAGSGTLFLDEIGDLSEVSQVKLLRVLQEREYQPLGSDALRPLRARVVAATNRPAKLRTDLYYRLRSYHVSIPPLRERPRDLKALLEHFVGLAATDLAISAPHYPPTLPTLLETYGFPGNVRELQAMVFHAVAQQRQGQLSLAAFEEAMEPAHRNAGASSLRSQEVSAGEQDEAAPLLQPQELERIERDNILRALHRARWKIAGDEGAAALLGLRPSTLASKMKKMGIERA